MSYMAVWYLDGRDNNYSNGTYHKALLREANLIANAGNTNPWALFMAYLGAIQSTVSDLIFPLLSVRAGDMSSSPWFLEWYGKDMVRARRSTQSPYTPLCASPCAHRVRTPRSSCTLTPHPSRGDVSPPRSQDFAMT